MPRNDTTRKDAEIVDLATLALDEDRDSEDNIVAMAALRAACALGVTVYASPSEVNDSWVTLTARKVA